MVIRMKSSYRIIKNKEIFHNEENTSTIDTKIDNIIYEEDVDLESEEKKQGEPEIDWDGIREEIKDQVLSDTNKKRNKIIDNAKEQAEDIKDHVERKEYEKRY